jgi:uncharacterized YigZ family protein
MNDAQAYKTVLQEAQAEIVIKKSRFIARLLPVKAPEEAAALLAKIRSRHWDAAHNVWAYLLRDGQQKRYSDDGEPQGTAGMPTLEAIARGGLTDCLCVVTRYFGGTLLGASGLTRAYAQSAAAAIKAADVLTMAPCQTLLVTCDYAFYGRLPALAADCGGAVLQSEYSDTVAVTLRIRRETAEQFAAALREASMGRYTPTLVEEGFARV